MEPKDYKLSEIIEAFISGDWGEESSSLESPNAVRCVRGADIVPIWNSDYDHIPIRFVSNRSFANKQLKVGDIIIEKSGGSPTQSTGRTAFVSEELISNAKHLVCTNFCTAFRIKPGWNPKYVYYYLQHLYNNDVFFNFEGKTSGLKNLQIENAFDKATITQIPIEKQNQIVKVLDTLDRKIALNRAINRNLEAIIKDITDYLFLSKKEKLNTSSIGEIASIKSGGDCPDDFSLIPTKDCFIPIYSNGTVNEGLYGYTSRAIIKGRSITVAARGTIGFCVRRYGEYAPIIRLLSVCPFELGADTYLHQIISRMTFKKNGSVQQQLTVPELSAIRIPYPSKEDLLEYDTITYPLILQINCNKKENDQLCMLRDELLPLLMNGQVEVKQLNSDLSAR